MSDPSPQAAQASQGPGAPGAPGELPTHHEDHPEMISRNVRYGLVLFSIYLVIYAGFVLLAAFAPRSMAATPLGGVNLAILYGMGLIFGAFALAAIYMYLCRPTNGNGDASKSTSARENQA